MKQDDGDQTLKKICPQCGKPSAGGRHGGSFTSYLFGASNCSCSDKQLNSRDAQRGLSAQNIEDVAFCPKCGLRNVTEQKGGSLTSWLFQSTRCKCIPDKAFAPGVMSAKFSKLREQQGHTVFLPTSKSSKKSTVSSIDLVPGATIGGAYKIITLLGRGGMGEVYLAKHETLSKKCALKVIPPEQVTEVGWQRFQLEAKSVAKLEHINLVRVTDLGIHEGCLPYYAMDYVDGKNLAEILTLQGPLPLKAVLEIFMQVCDGVEHAHRSGILHRDLKPGNIMLTSLPGGGKNVKVLDFGLAKLTGHDRERQSLTAKGDVFGSPFYMSPEQCRGERLDNRSDIYSIGCTMFECLTGQPPYTGHLAEAIIFSQMEADAPSLDSVAGTGTFPVSMEIIMAKLLRKNPVERYQTLSQLKADLERVSRGEEVLPIYASRGKNIGKNGKSTVKSVTSFQMPTSRANSSRPMLIGAVLFVLILAGAGGFCFFSWRQSEKIERVNQLLGAGLKKDRNIELPSSQLIASQRDDTRLNKLESLEANRDDSAWDGKPFYAGTVSVNGEKYRLWHLPSSMDGVMSLSFSERRHLDAEATVVSANEELHDFLTPMDAQCIVRVSPLLVQHREFIVGLTEGRFSTLVFNDCPFKDVQKLAALFAEFDSISSIGLGSENWSALDRQETMPIINRFPNLTEIALFCSLEGKQLLRSNRLMSLRGFDLHFSKADLQGGLEALSHFRNLNALVLRQWPGTANQLAPLAKCESVRMLRIGKLAGSHEELVMLSKMPRLQHLSLPDLRFRPGLIADLKLLKSLKRLTIIRQGNWTNAQLDILRLELTHISINVE